MEPLYAPRYPQAGSAPSDCSTSSFLSSSTRKLPVVGQIFQALVPPPLPLNSVGNGCSTAEIADDTAVAFSCPPISVLEGGLVYSSIRTSSSLYTHTNISGGSSERVEPMNSLLLCARRRALLAGMVVHRVCESSSSSPGFSSYPEKPVDAYVGVVVSTPSDDAAVVKVRVFSSSPALPSISVPLSSSEGGMEPMLTISLPTETDVEFALRECCLPVSDDELLVLLHNSISNSAPSPALDVQAFFASVDALAQSRRLGQCSAETVKALFDAAVPTLNIGGDKTRLLWDEDLHRTHSSLLSSSCSSSSSSSFSSISSSSCARLTFLQVSSFVHLFKAAFAGDRPERKEQLIAAYRGAEGLRRKARAGSSSTRIIPVETNAAAVTSL